MEFYFSVLEGIQEAEHNSAKDQISGKQGYKCFCHYIMLILMRLDLKMWPRIFYNQQESTFYISRCACLSRSLVVQSIELRAAQGNKASVTERQFIPVQTGIQTGEHSEGLTSVVP